MNFLRTLFLENYWFISQIFKIAVIFTYICAVILFGRFLLELADAIGKIAKNFRKNSKNLRKNGDKGDKSDTNFGQGY